MRNFRCDYSQRKNATHPIWIYSYSDISQTNLNKFQRSQNSFVSLQTLQNINTSHQHSKNFTGFLPNKESITKSVFSHTKHLQINNLLHIFTIVFYFRHTLFLRDLLIHSFYPFHNPYVRSSLGEKGFLCDWSTILEFTTSCYSKFEFFTNLPFQLGSRHTHLFKIAFPP